MGSVDCWPLAITFSRHLGVSPDQYPAIFLAVTGGRYPPLEWHMSQVHEELLSSQRIAVADCHLGNSVGAIGWHPGIRCSNRSACPGSRGFGLQGPASFRLTTLATHREGGLLGSHPPWVGFPVQDSYLVDSASSHMLVSKIKPCM